MPTTHNKGSTAHGAINDIWGAINDIWISATTKQQDAGAHDEAAAITIQMTTSTHATA